MTELSVYYMHLFSGKGFLSVQASGLQRVCEQDKDNTRKGLREHIIMEYISHQLPLLDIRQSYRKKRSRNPLLKLSYMTVQGGPSGRGPPFVDKNF